MTASFASALVGSDGNLTSSQHVASCDHTGTSSYMVNYDSDFSAVTGAQATVWGDGLTVGLNIFAENTCQVNIQDANGNPKDAGFSFFVPGTT